MRKAKILLRLSAGCIWFHAVGHTFGHFTWRQTDDPVKKTLIDAMDQHQFELMGAFKSLGQNFDGLSVNLTFTLLMMTAIVWVVSYSINDHPLLSKRILLPVALCLLAFAVADHIFFFLLASLMCLVAGALIITSLILVKDNEHSSTLSRKRETV